MNILGFFQKLALVEFRTKWIRIKRGPGVYLKLKLWVVRLLKLNIKKSWFEYQDTRCCNLAIQYVLPKFLPGPNIHFRFMKNWIHTSLVGSLAVIQTLLLCLCLHPNLEFSYLFSNLERYFWTCNTIFLNVGKVAVRNRRSKVRLQKFWTHCEVRCTAKAQ